MEVFDLATYLTNGVENIVKGILRATLKAPRESVFMLEFSKTGREAAHRRSSFEKRENTFRRF